MEDGVLGGQMTGPSEPPRRRLVCRSQGRPCLGGSTGLFHDGMDILSSYLPSFFRRVEDVEDASHRGAEAPRATLTTAQASFLELESFGLVRVDS